MEERNRRLKPGDWVEVRSKEEILGTLDSDGRLEGMPFMPEMLAFCGMRFEVYKRAHKTCDPDNKSRRVYNSVHLKTRCDGSAHGGCEAGCRVFWKEAWLKPVAGDAPVQTAPRESRRELINIQSSAGRTERAIWDGAEVRSPDGKVVSYSCQITQVQYHEPLPWWDVRQYLEDYWSGNITLRRLLSGTVYSLYYNLSQAGIGLGPAMRWLYEKARPLWGGSAWPRKSGYIPEGQPTPFVTLDLQPGELVRVKSHEEILKTVGVDNRNRGLHWDAELVPYCGGTYRVLGRVTRVLDEKTGKMQVMKNVSIILDTVVCGARYSACRMFCPRETPAFWREAWLERVAPETGSDRTTANSYTAVEGGYCSR